MKRYFNQLDQKNTPIDVYQLVFNEVEPPLLSAVMKFSNNNQSKAAKILGIDNELGSLEAGKEATFFISDGDALDIMSNNLFLAFIKGETIKLTNHQTELYEKFK